MKIGLIQLLIGKDKTKNLLNASKMITIAVDSGSKIVCLPECFNSPYGNKYFKEYAELIPGETSKFLSNLAKKLKVFIVAGTIPEKSENDFYNTCFVLDPKGDILVKYRKMHLFDIDIPGKISFQESKILKAGHEFITFDIDNWKFGLGVCYDLRFPELSLIYRKINCHVLLFPGAFNMTTGPVHWELLLRSRALDNQIYCAGISPARDQEADYIAYGHTLISDPWGMVISKSDEKENIIYASLDMKHLENIRQQIPIFKQKRHDLYDLKLTERNKLN